MKVLMVCLGNICRSPMAHGVMDHRAAERGIHVEVDSCGTGAWHAGELADPRTRAVLRRHGIPLDHRARQLRDRDFAEFDLLFAMDSDNLANMERRCPPEHRHKLHKLRGPTGGGDVPDPYYGGADGFDRVYDMVTEAVDAWLDRMPPGTT